MRKLPVSISAACGLFVAALTLIILPGVYRSDAKAQLQVMDETQRATALTQAWLAYQQTLSALGVATQVAVTQNPAFDTQIMQTIAANQTSLAVLNPTSPATIDAPLVPITLTVYAQGTVNVRSCPRRDCLQLGTVSPGQALPVNAYANGEAVRNGNTVWYRFGFNGRDGYIYSEFVSDQPAPTAPAPPPAAPAATSASFQGSTAQVIGPLTLGPGLYRARVTTSGFFAATLQVTQGDCQTQMFNSLFILMQGQANGAEATIQSNGCTTFIEVSNVTAPWRLEISQIG